jgi:hypothetical protein
MCDTRREREGVCLIRQAIRLLKANESIGMLVTAWQIISKVRRFRRTGEGINAHIRVELSFAKSMITCCSSVGVLHLIQSNSKSSSVAFGVGLGSIAVGGCQVFCIASQRSFFA